MSRFANLKNTPAAPKPEVQVRPEQPQAAPTATSRPPSRQGKRAVVGHFSPALVKALNVLAAEEETTVQALLGEAIDLLMRARGKHPFGEK